MKETPKAAQANKISTVKHKGDDPKFEQQQVPQGDSSKKKWKCGKRIGKKQKEKESKGSSSHAHTHIALVTYTSGPELLVDPCTLAHCPTSMYQGEQGPPFHTGIKDTIALAHWLELPITCENIYGLNTGLQIQGPGFLSATVCLPSSAYSSSPCPLSPSFSSAHNTSPLEYHLGIPASNYDFDVADHCLLEDEWLNGDSSTSCSLLYQAVEMQDEYPIASSSSVTLDSPPSSLAARLEPIYKSDKDSPPLAKRSKRARCNQIMAPPADDWDKEDLIDIYSSGVENDDDGFVHTCSYVLHSLCPHDSLMAALAPTASSYINMCGSVCPCNENHCNCSKCAHWHEEFMNH